MEEVLMRTIPKDSFTLVVSDNSANIQTTFSPPLNLQANRDYELAMVNLETYYSFATILPNVNTLQCILTVVGAKCKVSFDVSNSQASVLGFKQDISYGVVRHASEKLVNIIIWSVNSILVHCNIIHSSYMRGQQAPVVYNFFPNAAPGQKILEAPHNLIYLPVTVGVISTLAVWLTDQDGEYLDLRGEKLTIRFHLRER